MGVGLRRMCVDAGWTGLDDYTVGIEIFSIGWTLSVTV